MTMNLISKIFSPGNILLDSESTSKKRVFERVGMLFENEMQIGRSQVFDSLFAREKLGSTGLGQGVAIPHGRYLTACLRVRSWVQQDWDRGLRYRMGEFQNCGMRRQRSSEQHTLSLLMRRTDSLSH